MNPTVCLFERDHDVDDMSQTSADWATNRNAWSTSVVSPCWNSHPLLMDCENGEHDVTRVSLDTATEPYMPCGDSLWMEGLEWDPMLSHHVPSATSASDTTPWPIADESELNLLDEMDGWFKHGETETETTVSTASMSSEGGDGDLHFGILPSALAVPVSSTHFQERRDLLAASMRASHMSRQCLQMKEHVERRHVLQTVLKEVAQSTATVQRHCLLIHDKATEAPTTDVPGVLNATTSKLSTVAASPYQDNRPAHSTPSRQSARRPISRMVTPETCDKV